MDNSKKSIIIHFRNRVDIERGNIIEFDPFENDVKKIEKIALDHHLEFEHEGEFPARCFFTIDSRFVSVAHMDKKEMAVKLEWLDPSPPTIYYL